MVIFMLIFFFSFNYNRKKNY